MKHLHLLSFLTIILYGLGCKTTQPVSSTNKACEYLEWFQLRGPVQSVKERSYVADDNYVALKIGYAERFGRGNYNLRVSPDGSMLNWASISPKEDTTALSYCQCNVNGQLLYISEGDGYLENCYTYTDDGQLATELFLENNEAYGTDTLRYVYTYQAGKLLRKDIFRQDEPPSYYEEVKDDNQHLIYGWEISQGDTVEWMTTQLNEYGNKLKETLKFADDDVYEISSYTYDDSQQLTREYVHMIGDVDMEFISHFTNGLLSEKQINLHGEIQHHFFYTYEVDTYNNWTVKKIRSHTGQHFRVEREIKYRL